MITILLLILVGIIAFIVYYFSDEQKIDRRKSCAQSRYSPFDAYMITRNFGSDGTFNEKKIKIQYEHSKDSDEQCEREAIHVDWDGQTVLDYSIRRQKIFLSDETDNHYLVSAYIPGEWESEFAQIKQRAKEASDRCTRQFNAQRIKSEKKRFGL